jgi:drug/metabolite transporter (DMT)-like permease
MRSWLILILLGITWGSSYILIKRGLVAFSAEEVACLRITISALAFSPVFIYRYKKIEWSRWPAFLTVGIAGSGLPAFLFATAQTHLSSSLAGVLSSLTPLFTLLLGIAFFGIAFQVKKLVGVLIGLAGAVFLILFGNNSAELGGDLFYGSLVLLATGCYALSSNTVKTYLSDLDALTISAVSFFLIGSPAFVYLAFSDVPAQLWNATPHAWSSLGYIGILSLGGTVFASIFFFTLVQWRDALFASLTSYLVPIVALLWGLFDNETITLYHGLGLMLIMTGLYLSRR